MNTITNLPELVEEFFLNYADISQLKNNSLFLCRADGVPIYFNNTFGGEVSEASIGALLGGIWQAAKAMTDFIPKEEVEDVYRLSFDTTSKGLYIVPMTFGSEELYLGMIYFKEINPGLIKSKLRELSNRFKDFVEITGIDEKEENQFLFNNISDDEMDHIFNI